ncbi:hypothetical protein Zmor_021740 [Zophobas morio]|uniref:Tc1-like transposase DDE domain-containing protein n=1 Tax=Zophobas morio TaxID=2755281 RepID=A0AA38I6Y8_9CUCU|nr:hypothetical protein Zmor_021740 [Zophobas morio]
MGYKHREVNGRKILCEQKHVVAKITFLRTYLQLINSCENLISVYLDETWIYQNGASIHRWVHDTDPKSNPTKIKSEGSRFTILHAGCSTGSLDGCNNFLNSKNNDRDYHKAMDGTIFQNWVVNQLIPALAKWNQKCVVLLDNALYHSVQLDKPPTCCSKKCEMQEWFFKHSNEFDKKFSKKQLWNLIKPFRNNRKKDI